MEEELIKRILPHSDDAERSVIGCMMMNREAIMIASEILNGDEFYRQQMGIVFDSWWNYITKENRWILSHFRKN